MLTSICDTYSGDKAGSKKGFFAGETWKEVRSPRRAHFLWTGCEEEAGACLAAHLTVERLPPKLIKHPRATYGP
ncbi:hypothetical protein CROQUDRAFT_102729 [Cronartium quercuum f. sp. fusiforme G11]|uniref:Uncharacterized protein n=1 Tax=Cronartium quercuum f. sp. fusiforme G11 TaxID=708437 RepID=A0A9P6N749_9BASI|nr:hypothetical protein CROQUDRAFT_102729 [Cronartium quercuum f. sp. fusiforme G11]